MSVYVLEIAGRGVAAFNAKDVDEARIFVVEDDPFQNDLLVLQSEGEPLWDGDADLLVRDPFPEEQAYWQASQARAIKDGEIEDRDDTWLLFLVPVTDPTDDEI